MTNHAEYTPPRIWTWSQENGGAWASINRPISGATHDKDLPVGRIRCSFTHWARRTASRSR